MTFSPTLLRLIVGCCAVALTLAQPAVSEAQDAAEDAYVRAILQAEGQRWHTSPDPEATDAYSLAILQAEGQRWLAIPGPGAADAYQLAILQAEGQRMVDASNPEVVADLVVTMQPDGQIFSAPTADILWTSPLTTPR